MKKFKHLFIGIILGVFITGTAAYFVPQAGADNVWPFTQQQLVIMKQVKETLKEYQVDGEKKGKIDDDKMYYGAMKGIVSSLEDPYTRFVNPKDLEEELTQLKGEYGGLGMYISMKNDRVVVVSPMEGTPADRAGLKPMDEIVKVDSTSIIGKTTEDAVKLMRGDPGKPVTVQIRRKGVDKILTFKMVREMIKIKTVRSEMIGNDVAYIKINQFIEKTGKDVANALKTAKDKKAKGIIIDVRNNPGGLLHVCVDVASQFIDGGLIVSTKGRFDRANDTLYADKGRATKLPVVILINEGSASASEILAGAIKDRKRGTLIGTKSFGKGSVQTLFDLPDKSGVYITIARYATPSGFMLDKKGLQPDIKIAGDVEKDKKKDKQLQKALSVLRDKIAGRPVKVDAQTPAKKASGKTAPKAKKK
ncbi:MAG: S41 family peptidase [Synergistaceae bacterium]|nr:S41 family peptidase [Candidatus Equadaptatus faecalis]